jgi:hypothetical protein
VRSGYRPNFDIGKRLPDGQISYHDAQVNVMGRESIRPGETADVILWSPEPSSWNQEVVGSTINACEGHRIIGEAQVLELLAD